MNGMAFWVLFSRKYIDRLGFVSEKEDHRNYPCIDSCLYPSFLRTEILPRICLLSEYQKEPCRCSSEERIDTKRANGKFKI